MQNLSKQNLYIYMANLQVNNNNWNDNDKNTNFLFKKVLETLFTYQTRSRNTE